MANKCLFKILNQIYLFPHRPQKKGKLKGFHLDGNHVSFLNTLPNSSISTQVAKELKFGRLSPEWQPSAFSKYSTKFIYFHTGHKRKKIGKLFKTLYQRYIRMNNSCQLKKNKKIVSNEKQEKGSRCKLSSGPWWLSSHLWKLWYVRGSLPVMLLSSGTQAIGVQRLFEDWLLDIVLRSQLNYCIKK